MLVGVMGTTEAVAPCQRLHRYEVLLLWYTFCCELAPVSGRVVEACLATWPTAQRATIGGSAGLFQCPCAGCDRLQWNGWGA